MKAGYHVLSAQVEAIHLFVTDFHRLRLPPCAINRARAMKWRKGNPALPDRRYVEARAWLRYEKRVHDWSREQYMRGENPIHAPEWDNLKDG